MEFILIFGVILFQIILVYLFDVVEVVRTFRIDAFMEDEVFAFFLWDEGVAAVGTAQFYGGEAAFVRGESGRADLAQKLSFGAIIPI